MKYIINNLRDNRNSFLFFIAPLFVIPILMYCIFYLIKKENQRSKNILFLVWLSVLNIILIVAFYNIFVTKFDYYNDMIGQLNSLETTVNRHNRELNALKDNTGP